MMTLKRRFVVSYRPASLQRELGVDDGEMYAYPPPAPAVAREVRARTAVRVSRYLYNISSYSKKSLEISCWNGPTTFVIVTISVL